jgi:hypothetical protein
VGAERRAISNKVGPQSRRVAQEAGVPLKTGPRPPMSTSARRQRPGVCSRGPSAIQRQRAAVARGGLPSDGVPALSKDRIDVPTHPTDASWFRIFQMPSTSHQVDGIRVLSSCTISSESSRAFSHRYKPLNLLKTSAWLQSIMMASRVTDTGLSAYENCLIF